MIMDLDQTIELCDWPLVGYVFDFDWLCNNEMAFMPNLFYARVIKMNHLPRP